MKGFKKFLGQIIVVLALGLLAQWFFPWWIFAAVAGVVAIYFNIHPGASFGAGFTAGSMLWSTYAIFINVANQGVLSEKIGQLFMGLSGAQLIYITGLIGGLLGGFGALTGSLGRRIFQKPATHQ